MFVTVQDAHCYLIQQTNIVTSLSSGVNFTANFLDSVAEKVFSILINNRKRYGQELI